MRCFLGLWVLLNVCVPGLVPSQRACWGVCIFINDSVLDYVPAKLNSIVHGGDIGTADRKATISVSFMLGFN